MLNHAEGWRGSQGLATILAIASSLFFAILFWTWERDLLWMLAVILPPIWSPVVYRRFVDDEAQELNRMAVGGLLIGLFVLFGLGLLVYVAG